MNKNVNYQTSSKYYSYHAKKRSAQRGINKTLADIAIDFGEVYHAGKGGTAYWLNKKCVEKIKLSMGSCTDAVNIAVIVGADEKIITVMYCDNKAKHWKLAA